MTPEERKSIIEEAVNKAVEKTLLSIPEVIGNLMASQATMANLNREFYAKHPEFKDKKDSVMSVVEQVEGKNPLMKYEDILKKSVPKIRERINTMKNLDMTNVSKHPNRTFEPLDTSSDKPHGEL